MSVYASNSPSGRRCGEEKVNIRSATVIKPCTRQPSIELEDVGFPKPEDLTTTGRATAADMAGGNAAPLPPSSGHDDRYPCLRRALQCGETPILPLGTYAVEFGFDVSCALPFVLTSGTRPVTHPTPSSTYPAAPGAVPASRPMAPPMFSNRTVPDVTSCPPPPPGGTITAETFPSMTSSVAGHQNVRFRPCRTLSDPAHACATTHSLCHMHRVAQQQSSTVTASNVLDADGSPPCCSTGSPPLFLRNRSSVTASATVINGRLPERSCHDRVGIANECRTCSTDVMDRASCSVAPIDATFTRLQQFLGAPHSLPTIEHYHNLPESTRTSSSTYTSNPPTTIGQSSKETNEQQEEQDLFQSTGMQKRFRQEPHRYVYAEVWKKDNRTWLWKRRDPSKQQSCNLKTGDSNRRLTTHWKKDNRSWLWKSSSKSNPFTFSKSSKTDDK